jgi:RHS repeat-associated protein
MISVHQLTFHDQIGSIRQVVNASTGLIAQEIKYDEFGMILSDTNPGFQPFGFAGGLWDRDIEMIRFGARDYDPSVGKWSSKDALLFGGGTSNLLEYCGNDPVNCVDPYGLLGIKDVLDSIGTGLAIGAATGIGVGLVATPATGFATGLSVAAIATAYDLFKKYRLENPNFIEDFLNRDLTREPASVPRKEPNLCEP